MGRKDIFGLQHGLYTNFAPRSGKTILVKNIIRLQKFRLQKKELMFSVALGAGGLVKKIPGDCTFFDIDG